MAMYICDISIPCYNIEVKEFNELKLEDVNYSGILFAFTKEHVKLITNKLITEWDLGKSDRLSNVIKTGMFYVENCDIQTIDSGMDLICELYYKDTIKKIYILEGADIL